MKICSTCGTCYDDEAQRCTADGAEDLELRFVGSRVLGGRYRLEQRMDAGGMGAVFRSTHVEVGSTVAVKLLHKLVQHEELLLARFQREAKVLGQIKHPNAVLVMDFGVEDRPDGRIPYLVTEHLRGESLLKRLEVRGKLSLMETARIIAPLSEALAEAHGAGVVHRDVKPSNVFLERLRDGSEIVKVLDFGVAKILGPVEERAVPEPSVEIPLEQILANLSESSDTNHDPPGASGDPSATLEQTLTSEGLVVGTVQYMAPEQLSGGPITPAADVYALATLTYRLLSGRLPFDGPTAVIAQKKLQGVRPRLSDHLEEKMPEGLDQVLLQAFALSPGDRPGSAELGAAIREAALAGPESEQTATRGAVPYLLRLAEAFERFAQTVGQKVSYELIRDSLLTLEAPIYELKNELPRAGTVLKPREREELSRAIAQVEEAQKKMTAALRGAALDRFSERRAYLITLEHRLNRSALEVLRTLGPLLALPSLVPSQRTQPGTLFDDEQSAERDVAIVGLVRDLGSKDVLVRDDALELILSGHLEAMVARLGADGPDAVADEFLAGAWSYADELLLRDLFPAGAGGFRLLPFLAKLRHRAAAQPFSMLAKVFRRAHPDDAAETARVELAVEGQPLAIRSMLWRCLLVSPIAAVRQTAAAQVPLSDLWTLTAYPRAPLSAVRNVFDRVRALAHPEYLKVFFLCVRDAIQYAATSATREQHADLFQAFELLSAFFGVPCFHEDLVFEPLLDLEGELRRAAEAVGMRLDGVAKFEDLVADFRRRGITDSSPVDSLRDVPLAIQRKLARRGHLLSYFVTHPNDRVALETVQHLLRREEVVSFLRLPKIHKLVLIALSKEDRFFRREEPRIALLQNPKTPAHVARRFVPFLSNAQLKQLVQNRHLSSEVRLVAGAVLKKKGIEA
ncbi:MAG: serine/threonine-protein kinase [Myxococcota bacterium]